MREVGNLRETYKLDGNIFLYLLFIYQFFEWGGGITQNINWSFVSGTECYEIVRIEGSKVMSV